MEINIVLTILVIYIVTSLNVVLSLDIEDSYEWSRFGIITCLFNFYILLYIIIFNFNHLIV
jgi:hypothetical protein